MQELLQLRSAELLDALPFSWWDIGIGLEESGLGAMERCKSPYLWQFRQRIVG
jgi:hypothetical protein